MQVYFDWPCGSAKEKHRATNLDIFIFFYYSYISVRIEINSFLYVTSSLQTFIFKNALFTVTFPFLKMEISRNKRNY